FGQSLGLLGVGFLALHLVGQALQGLGRFLHLLLRLWCGRLLLGGLLRLFGRLLSFRLALRGLGGVEVGGLAGQLLLLAGQFLLLLRRRFRISCLLSSLPGQVFLLAGQ